MIDLLLIGATRFLVGGAPHWVGCEPTRRQRIYFANHGSHLDTLLIWAALPAPLRGRTHPVAAADYWGGEGVMGRIARDTLKAVLVNRAGGAEAGDPLAPLRDMLAKGESLIIFPEGTRTTERLPGPFKSGLYRLALDFPQVELIPVYLENPGRAFPKGALIPVPIACAVRFGAPLALGAQEDKAAFLARARAAVSELAP
ncbi:MAG: 1-acyl-sn-glycerol-3-phosphate acyltransferase [Methylobacteriaceae bacterium]|nr:1-acyl-sn-glycerol-3-phosphate acyltransferase [Methylobacteriaceae bacterium]